MLPATSARPVWPSEVRVIMPMIRPAMAPMASACTATLAAVHPRPAAAIRSRPRAIQPCDRCRIHSSGVFKVAPGRQLRLRAICSAPASAARGTTSHPGAASAHASRAAMVSAIAAFSSGWLRSILKPPRPLLVKFGMMRPPITVSRVVTRARPIRTACKGRRQGGPPRADGRAGWRRSARRAAPARNSCACCRP